MAAAHSWYLSTNFGSILTSPPKIAAQFKPKPTPPPIYISTNPSHVNPNHLRELYAACNLTGHRFPTVDAAGRVELVDELKIRTALSHSSVVVSAFTKPEFLTARSSNSTDFVGIGGDWIRKVAPVTPENGRLIGFGRAVSDLALTASIYDVMVHPDLQGRGIGRMIVKRIVRMLINRDIYDIAALCASNERLFLKSCGFGDDIMGSTTMMYTRSSSSYSEDKQIVSAGRKLLLVPHSRELSK
ncbi:hypothetical protein CASFOL_003057 [Castilleja foliolosa]|uniref:N-acetyltransferase domain-containing protein n=1 Tax=Castilleja foliolosa TaxID=1961234 RepID=A0ABD3EGF1_9LAMI